MAKGMAEKQQIDMEKHQRPPCSVGILQKHQPDWELSTSKPKTVQKRL